MEDPELQKARVAKEVSYEQESNEVSVSQTETLDATRYLVATLSVKAIIAEAKKAYPDFEDCEFRFFMFDDDAKKLFAVLHTGRPERGQQGWKRKEGVTGLAYDTGDYQIATGSGTHDGTYNLDKQRQQEYIDLTEVAAMPVKNAQGVTLGILSASHTTGRTILATEESRKAHSTAADALARVVIDLLGWRSEQDSPQKERQ